MFKFFVIAVSALSLTSAGVSKDQQKIVVLESQPQSPAVDSTQSYEIGGYSGEFEGHVVSDDRQSNGAELTSLAHSSALQAKNAVQNQLTAGNQAAFGVKSSFASAALGAAQTAQAALVGKQAIVQNIRRQLIEAQQQLQGEISQYQQTDAASQIAQAAAQHAQGQVNTLTAALAASQSGAQQANQAATEAANITAAQQSMVVEAKQRVARILSQLQSAIEGLQETEIAAQRAAEAAQIAQSNAASAGAAVAAASVKGAQSDASNSFHHY